MRMSILFPVYTILVISMQFRVQRRNGWEDHDSSEFYEDFMTVQRSIIMLGINDRHAGIAHLEIEKSGIYISILLVCSSLILSFGLIDVYQIRGCTGGGESGCSFELKLCNIGNSLICCSFSF